MLNRILGGSLAILVLAVGGCDRRDFPGMERTDEHRPTAPVAQTHEFGNPNKPTREEYIRLHPEVLEGKPNVGATTGTTGANGTTGTTGTTQH